MKITNNQDDMNKKFDVVVIGEINVDLILNGNVDPQFGQVEQIVDDANLQLGSSAVIFACGAAKLGLKTAFIGVVGDDLFGTFMINELNKKSINTDGVIIKPSIKTGLSVILTKKNDRAILTHLGSIPELIYSDINFEIIAQSKHLHLASYFMLDNLRPDLSKLFDQVKELGLSISIDTNYDPKELWNGGINDLLKIVDIFLPNQNELLAITKQKNLETAIVEINKLVPIVVVKMGKEGAIGKMVNKPQALAPSVEVDVVDTVGAGDSFDAGFIYGYLKQFDLMHSIQIAIVCGSLSTRKPGGTSAQPDFDEVKEYLGKMNKNYDDFK